VPQAPQFELSERVSTQVPPHSRELPGHSVVSALQAARVTAAAIEVAIRMASLLSAGLDRRGTRPGAR
jgi:hypothetical protein